MKILNFVKSLLPFFPRSTLQEEFRVVSNDLHTMVLPAINNTAKDYPVAFTSKEAKDLQSAYRAFVRGDKGKNLFGDIAVKTAHIKKIVEALEAEIASGFDEKIASAGISIRKASVIRLIGVIGFTNRFTLALTNAIMHFENAALGNEMTFISDITPGEMQRLHKGIADYAEFMEGLSKVKDTSALLNGLPEVLAESEEIAGGLGKDLDPFGIFGQSNFRGSPVFYFQMHRAEQQHKRYKRSQAQVQTLSKRVLAAKRALAGQPSPELEAQLERDTALIATISEELRKYEDSLA